MRTLRANVWHAKLFKAYIAKDISLRELRVRTQPLVSEADSILLEQWAAAQLKTSMEFKILASYHNRIIDKHILEITDV